ncbi:MAG: FecCD family ABC transporter permease [Phycisphaerae bacterium]
MSRHVSAGRLVLVLLLSTLAWAIVAVACLAVDSTGNLAWPAGLALQFQAERVLLASLVGGALASAGVAYQAVLRNPLAEPYLLGAATGAAFAAYLWRLPAVGVWLVGLGGVAASLSQQAFAFLGAVLAIGVVLGLAGARRLEPVAMILIGVIVNATLAAGFLLVNALVRDLPGTGGIEAILIGDLQTNLLPSQAYTAAAVVAAGWGVLLWLSGAMNIARLSEAEAQSLGLRIVRLRWGVMLAASLVTAAAVAVSGPIGFVGLICPHLVRLVVGQDNRLLLPAATAAGAVLLCLADAARTFAAAPGLLGTVVPIGVVTALLGGPFFLLLFARTQRHGG